MGKGRVENLTPFSRDSVEIARESGRKGGLASGVTKQRRKLIRETINEIMPLEVSDQELREALQAAGLAPSYENAMVYSALRRAAKGDIEAARFIRDTRGEKPAESLAITPILDQPVSSWDMSKLTDEELMAIAAMAEEQESLPPAQ